MREGCAAARDDLASQNFSQTGGGRPLSSEGFERVFKDVGSGSPRSRPQLDACLERLGGGDTLIVWRLDRHGRSPRHLLTVLAELSELGVAFQSLTEAIDTTTAAGRLQVHLFAALAEFERSLGQERTRAGLEAARARGRIGGRPAVVTSRKLAAALTMRDHGDLTMTQIAEELGVSPASLYRRLARHRQETDVIETASKSHAVAPSKPGPFDRAVDEIRTRRGP